MLTRCSEKSYNVLSESEKKEVALLEEDEIKLDETGADKTEEKRTSHRRRSRRRRHRRRRVSGAKLITLTVSVIVMLAFCVIMISPLRGCVMQDDYIGKAAAEKVAFNDAGVSSDEAENVSADMIKLDDNMCYKVDFTANKTEYSYIISADTGKIIISRNEAQSDGK